MALADTIIVGLVLFLPFFFLVILPTVLAYFYGNKSLLRAKSIYSKAVARAAKKAFGDAKVTTQELDKLNQVFFIRGKNLDLKIELSLVERRTYAYYFAKIFGSIPDTVFLKTNIDKMPPAILYMVSRHRKRLLEKSTKYIYALDEINLGALKKDILALSDNVRFAAKYFDKEVVELMRKITKPFNYMIIDYRTPHVEFSLQLKENEAQTIETAILLTKKIIENVRKVKGKGKESDALAYIRKVLREEK
ncbi:MAG: hypothetical protein ACP6IP_00215 [Candidatus Njordarchaeia archaeon]